MFLTDSEEMQHDSGANETAVRRERQNAPRISESRETTGLLQGLVSLKLS